MKLILYLSILSALLLASCKNVQDDFATEFGFDYYPLKVGKYLTYHIDSIIYDPTGDSLVRSSSIIKETIVDSFIDLSGTPVFRIEQYQRMADTLPWTIKNVITASISSDVAIRVEDNFRFIKLTFPLWINKTWNGNAFFDPNTKVIVAGETLEMFKSWNYKVLGLAEPHTVGSFSFPDVATIQNADNENLIEYRKAFEQYAKGVGLVYRELWILDSQCIEDCIGLSWEEKAEKGFILKQTLIDYN